MEKACACTSNFRVKAPFPNIFTFWLEDINPAAPAHVLLIPKKHIKSLNELSIEDSSLIGHIFAKAKDIAKELKVDNTGYRIVMNCGKDGGQEVQHIHFHLLGGRNLSWPPG